MTDPQNQINLCKAAHRAAHARVNDLLKRLQKAAAGEANAGNVTYANVGSMNEIARILETAAAFLNAT